MTPAVIISLMFMCPLANAMALGGVATGIMKHMDDARQTAITVANG
jgi:hypothetical protein